MNTMDRNKTLLEVIRQGLEVYSKEQTQKTLGDRSRYIGISDLARYNECQRAALLSKFHEADTSLETLLTLQRGHWFEEGINKSLAMLGLKFMPQLEIAIQHEGTPICAHLDLTFVWDKPRTAVHVLEIKSTGNIPNTPYESHETQVKAQINLLYRYWKKPVFSLRDPSGSHIYDRLSFPQISKQYLGIALPETPQEIQIESWLIYLSMKNAQVFGPYKPGNGDLEQTLNMASGFWQQFRSLKGGYVTDDALQYASGFNPLCGYCGFKADCPKFTDADMQPQWETALQKLDGLKNNRSGLDTEIREIESSLKQAHELSGVKGWINTGQHRFRVTNAAGRHTLDRTALREELIEIFRNANLESIDVDALLSRCERESAPSSRLNIMNLN